MDSVRGFTKWPFMTTHMWNENPRGKWILTVDLKPQDNLIPSKAYLTEWILVIHGTQKPPYYQLSDEVISSVPKLEVVTKKHASKRFQI